MIYEEAIEKIEITWDTDNSQLPTESMMSFSDVVQLVYKIYDDFKLELEAEYKRGQDTILSRSCESCKFGIDGNGREIECAKA